MDTKPDIVVPRKEPISYQENFDAYFATIDDSYIVDNLCRHVSMGGTVIDYCKMLKIDYHQLMNVIRGRPEFNKQYKQAIENRKEWTFEAVQLELNTLALNDLSEAYKDNGDLKNIADMPPGVRKAIAGIKKTTRSDKDGAETETVEVKFTDKIKALDMICKKEGLYQTKIEVKQTMTLEGLLTESFQDEPDTPKLTE